jgi:hypothetical protein
MITTKLLFLTFYPTRYRIEKKHMQSNKQHHDLSSGPSSRAPCKFFVRYGACGFGDACRYAHDSVSMVVSLHVENKSATQGTTVSSHRKPCAYFAKGLCNRGTACRFDHGRSVSIEPFDHSQPPLASSSMPDPNSLSLPTTPSSTEDSQSPPVPSTLNSNAKSSTAPRSPTKPCSFAGCTKHLPDTYPGTLCPEHPGWTVAISSVEPTPAPVSLLHDSRRARRHEQSSTADYSHVLCQNMLHFKHCRNGTRCLFSHDVAS